MSASSCDLCAAARLTPWWYEDDVCWIAECESCSVPMVVWKLHGATPSADSSWSTCLLGCVKLPTNTVRRATGSTTPCGRSRIITTRTLGGGRSRDGGVDRERVRADSVHNSVRPDVVHGASSDLGQTVSADSSTLCGTDCQVGGNFLMKTLILQKVCTRCDCAATSTHSEMRRRDRIAHTCVAYCGDVNPADVLPAPSAVPLRRRDPRDRARVSRPAGRWTLTGEEWFFAGHFPGRPTLPGVLMCEAIAQVGAFAVLRDERFAGQAAAVRGDRQRPLPPSGRAG